MYGASQTRRPCQPSSRCRGPGRPAGTELPRYRVAALTPGPLAAAIGSVVPPGTSDEAVRQLTQLVNLICHGDTTRAEAQVSLQDRGLDTATAAQVLGAAGRVQPCPAAGT